MPKRVAPETDSQKIRLIPEIMEALAEINRILITGNLEADEPGLLEIVRGIKKSVDAITQRQSLYEELEKRVRELELEQKRDEERRKRADAFTIATYSIALSNVVMIVLWLLGFGR